MRDILLKRNELLKKSKTMRSMRFEPGIKDEQVQTIAKEQDKFYNKWNFYDKFVKAREEAKHEIKSNNVGKEE